MMACAASGQTRFAGMTSANADRLELTALRGVPMVQPGDDLPTLITAALERSAIALLAGDVIVVAQKIVSKAEGRMVDLATVEPSPRAVDARR